MKNEEEFHNYMLYSMLINTISDKLQVSTLTNWHPSHPYYRLNFYDHIQVSQVLGVYLLFTPEFVKQFDTIIEIGTFNGGLSAYLHDMKNSNAKLVSYDIDGTINTAKLHRNRTEIDFRVEDCFAETTKQDIIDMIKSSGKTLVLCDGGDKPLEFNVFSEYLKPGDMIGLHDFRLDDVSFSGVASYWQWPYKSDASIDDIKKSIEKYNLKPYENNNAPFFLWGLYVKYE